VDAVTPDALHLLRDLVLQACTTRAAGILNAIV
jgi:hypothetical protein